MKVLKIIGGIAGAIVSIGTGAIVGNVIHMSTPADTKMVKKICINVGGFVLGCMASDAANDYLKKQINDFATEVKNATEQKEEGEV